MSSQTYPLALRSLFKSVPCLVMCVSASFVFYIANHAFVRHEHDHIPKFTFRSTKLGVYTRQRDDRNRDVYQKMINFDPNRRATALKLNKLAI